MMKQMHTAKITAEQWHHQQYSGIVTCRQVLPSVSWRVSRLGWVSVMVKFVPPPRRALANRTCTV